MRNFRPSIILAIAAFVLASCAGPSEKVPASSVANDPAKPEDFGEVTLQAFERHPNLRKVPERWIQDSMFACALSWRSDHTTPGPERSVNAAKAYDLMAEGNWKEMDPYCRLSELKKHLP